MTEIVITRVTDEQEALRAFEYHLVNVLGASEATRRQYRLRAGNLLKWISRNGVVDWRFLTAEAIATFINNDIAPRTGQGPKVTLAAVRAFLRFLVSTGAVREGLANAVPKVKCWSQASLPRCLSEPEINKLLSLSRSNKMNGRNYAVLMLLSRLGLRASEVADLRLSDVDWTNGSILIRSSKTRTERVLPLRQDVGEALLYYLEKGRPCTNCRSLLVQDREPCGPMHSSGITKMVTRLLRQGNIQVPRSGPHLFRHTVATQMINCGVTFKDIADLLGHQSLSTTAIYAKLDMSTLLQVALPWLGGKP